MLYRLYHFLTSVSAPVLNRLAQKRLVAGKEDPARIGERRGETQVTRPDGKLIWVHGASVGESLSVLPLLSELQQRLPGWRFLMTTGTVTSARLMKERLPAGMIHQFVPWDQPKWVKRFMDHWRPDCVLWLESELWPNMLHEIQKRNIPAALLNARMRPATLKKWRMAKGLTSKMLGAFSLILSGARDYIAGFESLGGKNVRYIGNLKFGAAPLPVDAAEINALRDKIGNRVCLGFLQTHPGEEALAGEIYRELKKSFPDLLLIITPRKHTRGAEIKQELQGLSIALRTENDPVTADTDIYIADTIGEMGLWYSLCPIVVIGGSFIPFGGQNPLEGTHFGAAILYGPCMFNFPELCLVLEEAKASRRIASRAELLPELQSLLSHPQELSALQHAAKQLAGNSVAVTRAFADAIISDVVRGQG